MPRLARRFRSKRVEGNRSDLRYACSVQINSNTGNGNSIFMDQEISKRFCFVIRSPPFSWDDDDDSMRITRRVWELPKSMYMIHNHHLFRQTLGVNTIKKFFATMYTFDNALSYIHPLYRVAGSYGEWECYKSIAGCSELNPRNCSLLQLAIEKFIFFLYQCGRVRTNQPSSTEVDIASSAPCQREYKLRRARVHKRVFDPHFEFIFTIKISIRNFRKLIKCNIS